MLKPSVIAYQKEVLQFKPWPKGNRKKQKRKAKQSHKTICQTPVRACKESRVEPKKLFSREVEEQENI